MYVNRLLLCCCFLCMVAGKGSAQITSNCSNIRLNQLGFFPEGPKIAILKGMEASDFILINAKGKTVFNGNIRRSELLGLDGKYTYIADFSAFKKEGLYTLSINKSCVSDKFSISNNVYDGLCAASIKAFYYQRASTSLPAKYAGKWHREAGHPDDHVFIHASAASALRATETVTSAPGGWYDAGDYNKYIVNSGITMGTLLSLYEDFPKHITKLDLNIPESKNEVPDELDEVLYNLRWMLKMQDPNDGGVYNKLTNANFDGFVMPSVTKDARYVVQKGTAATLDFAAVMAQSSRIFKDFSSVLPGLSDSCLSAAKNAWTWALRNPSVIYDQQSNNLKFLPVINTGGYGDQNLSDEWIWAGIELYLTSNEERYLASINMFPDETMPVPGWSQVKLMGYYSLLRKKNSTGQQANPAVTRVRKMLLAQADQFVSGLKLKPWQTVMGKRPKDYGWGSNATAANQGILLLQAYRLTGNRKYKDAAQGNLDYLLGRNASGYSYVTGFGVKTPMFPHHRPSAADGITEPIPGFLVGGANPGQQDGVKLPSAAADEAYADVEESFATNEVAINWNAPLVYLVNALTALKTNGAWIDSKNETKL